MNRILRTLCAYLCIFSVTANAAGPTIWGPDSRALNLTTQGYTLQSGVTLDNDGITNFVKAATAETSTQPAAWSTYADAAQTTPVDCTGGSANITWTRNTTTPLRGAADFKLTKDAADRQGQGVAYAFTTGPSDGAGELLTVTMPVKATEDAAYATGDIGVYVYNVTGAALITPTIVNVEDSAYQFTAQFNLASSSSYRLCIHVASTNSSAYDVYFDDITVGLQKYDWPGQINLSNSPIDATGWVASGSGVTVATTTTSTDLPLGSPYASSAIKITPVSGTTDYARSRVFVPAALASTMLKAEWYQRPLSGYASGDLKFDVYSNSASDCSGSFTRIALSTDSSSVTSIPNATGKYTTTFLTDGSSVCYEVRFTRVAGTTALNITNFVFGPGIQPQGAVVGDWQTYTLTITAASSNPSEGAGATKNTWYRRVGSSIEIHFEYSQAAAGSAGTGVYRFSLPSGLTVDSTKTTITEDSTAIQRISLGSGMATQGSAWQPLSVYAATSTTFGLYSTTTGNQIASSSFALSNNPQRYAVFATIPIAEWANSGTVNLANNTPEYAYNSSTSTSANDTSSFGYGPAGAQIQNITATLYRDVTLQYPVQVGDYLDVQVSSDRTTWLSAGARIVNSSGYTIPQFGYSYNGATYRGIGILPQSSTVMRVYFGEYQTTYSSTNISWTTGGGGALYWRVVHGPPGSAVGFGLASLNSAGLLTKQGISSTSSTWTMNGSGGTSSSTTLRYQRIGDWVTLHIPGFSLTSGTSSTTITSNTAIDSSYRPATTTQSVAVSGVRNNGGGQSNAGYAEINTSGIITIFRDGGGTAFTNATSCGMDKAATVTYYVGSGS